MIEFFILITAFSLRLFPRIILKESWNYDTYFHMAMSRMIRENNFRIPKKKERISLSDKVDYPWFFHWMFAFIPDSILHKTEKIFSAILDTLHIALAMWMTERFFLNINISESYYIVIWVGLLMTFTPSFLRIGMGPRAYNATPRVLSQLIIMIFLSSILFWYQENNIIWLISACIAVLITVLSSKFGIQAIVLISFILMLFGYYEAFVMVLLGSFLAIVFFKEYVIILFNAHSKSMLYYYTTLAKKYRGLMEQKACIRCYLSRAKENFMTSKMLNWFFMDQYPLHLLLFFMPQIWLLFFYQQNLSSEFDFIFAVVVVSFIIFVIVSTPRFTFIGEAERYLEHTVYFQFFLLVVLMESLNETVLYVILFWFILCYTQYVRLYIKYNKRADNIPKQLAPLLRLIDQEGNVVYPIGSYTWVMLYYFKRAKICYPATSWNTTVSKEDLNKLVGNYPYPGTSLQKLSEEFNINYVITDENAYETYQGLIKDSLNDKFELIHRSGIFMVLKAKKEGNAN